jgi:hypothetical protein
MPLNLARNTIGAPSPGNNMPASMVANNRISLETTKDNPPGIVSTMEHRNNANVFQHIDRCKT